MVLVKCVLTPIGKLYVGAENEQIVALDMSRLEGDEASNHPLLCEAARQLEAYFSKKLCTFSLPLNPSGSAFQKAVWRELCVIPYGEVRSYQEIACAVGNAKASRAVGNANNKNPLMIIVPCHRVLSHSYHTLGLSPKALGGYAFGLETKQYLLRLEGVL